MWWQWLLRTLDIFNLHEKGEFKEHFNEVLRDGKITKKELNFLVERAKSLGLGEAYVYKSIREEFHRRAQPLRNKIESSRRFSPDDEALLVGKAKALKVNLNYKDAYQIFRNLWEYENDGVLKVKPIESSIILGKDEFCFYSTPCIWEQFKTIRERQGSYGAAVGIPITKGVRFYVGRSFPVPPKEYDEMHPVSDGEIYITNKKLLFNGNMKSTNITMKRMIEIQLFSGGLEIRKTSGKPDFFSMGEADAEYISAILHSILNEQLEIIE